MFISTEKLDSLFDLSNYIANIQLHTNVREKRLRKSVSYQQTHVNIDHINKNRILHICIYVCI